MTIPRWPGDGNQAPPKSDRESVVDPLPWKVLHLLVSDLPGPRGETETERAVRFQAQLAEVLGYQPRNSAEAMIATHCVTMRLLTEHARCPPDAGPAIAKKVARASTQMRKLVAEMEKALARRQTQPLGGIDPALAVAVGLREFLSPDPEQPEEAFSAVVVPLHPAPKLLQ